MKRLIKTLGKNSASEYNKIFKVRQQKEPNWADVRRWKTLLEFFKGGSLVDLGCLDSLVIPYAYERYPEGKYYGVDIAKEAVSQMGEDYPYAFYQVQNVYQLRFKNETFDYAVAGEIIEHLEDPRKFIKEAFRVLKSGGVMAVSTPLEEEREVGAVDGERHIWSYTEQDVRDLVTPYGEVLKTHILRSRHSPYAYCWPQLICFVKKI